MTKQRMTWLLLWCSVVFQDICFMQPGPQSQCSVNCPCQANLRPIQCLFPADTCHLDITSLTPSVMSLENLQKCLLQTLDNILSTFASNLVTLLYKPTSPFTAPGIYANATKALANVAVMNIEVIVQLPRELDAGPTNVIVFLMLTLPKTNGTMCGAPGLLYKDRLVGLSVLGKTVLGLHEPVNITMNVTTAITETQELRCVFFNFSTCAYSSDGCLTQWKHGQSHITCSCDHLTYFGVLMVSSPISSEDKEILSYITLIGCSVSLFCLIITVLLFITNKQVRADVSMKVHISLAIAMILLNVHFLPSQKVAALSSTGLCVYMAVALHYSLLASFSWMALEGFHLYILLVRVFNIYIRRYLLKLSVVGWGIPAVIVSLVAIIDRTTYGSAPLDSSNPNGTTICYINNNTVKMVTTMGVFGLVFIFNVTMLGVTVRRVISLHQNQEFGQSNRDRTKRDVFTLLGVTTLLGITWGLVFFWLTTPGLYLFCILNSLQGFFIFLWFLMTLRKLGKSAAQTSSEMLRTS